MSPDPLPLPAQCQPAYDRYVADLGRSPLAASTRASHARCVRHFLRWLYKGGYTGDLRRDWATVTSGYLLHLASRGNAASTILRQRAGLNDCAACLGLPRVKIPSPPGRNGCPSPPAAGPPPPIKATGDR